MGRLEQMLGKRWTQPAACVAVMLACAAILASCGGQPPPQTALAGPPAPAVRNDPPNLAELLEQATNDRAPGAVAITARKAKPHDVKTATAAPTPAPAGA